MIALISISLFVFLNQKNILTSPNKLFTKKTSYHDKLIDDFIMHAMIRNYSLYTLFGFKPITAIHVPDVLTEEERKRAYDNLPDWKKKEIPYNKFLVSQIDTKTQWIAFKKKIEQLNIKEYFFVEYDKEYDAVLFVHKPSLLYILIKYHDQFKKELNEEFDPLEKIEELKSGGSKFWDKIFKNKNHYLMGLIFGFGEKNSRFFQLEQDKTISIKRVNHVPIKEIKTLMKDKLCIENLCLPMFISYLLEDEMLEDYRKKRETIIKYMKGKELTQEVFFLLESKKIDVSGDSKREKVLTKIRKRKINY